MTNIDTTNEPRQSIMMNVHGAHAKEKFSYRLTNNAMLKSEMNLVDKKILAKSSLAWQQKPYVVCKGAAICISVFDSQKAEISENDAAKIVLYEYIESLISKINFDISAYRTVTVAYTVAYLSYLVSNSDKSLDFNQIFDNPSVLNQLDAIVTVISKDIHKFISTPKEGYEYLGQWQKQQDCWNAVKALPIDIVIPESLLC